MRFLPEKLFKIFTLVFILFFGSILLINIAIDNPYSHRFVGRLLETVASRHSRLGFSFQGISLRVFPTQLHLYGLRLTLPEKDHREIFHASHVNAQLSWWSMVLGKPALSFLDIFDPTVMILEDLKKEDFLKESPSSPQEESQKTKQNKDKEENFTFIKKVNIYDGRIIARFLSPVNVDKIPETYMDVLLGGVTVHYGLNGHISWKIQDGTVKESDRFFFDHVVFEGQGNKSVVNPKELLLEWDLASPPLNLKGRGKLDFHQNQVFQDLILDGELKVLGEFLNIPHTKGQIKGQFQLASHFHSKEQPSLLIKGPVEVSQGMIDSFLLHDVKSDIEIDLNEIRFQKTNMSIDGAEPLIHAEGSIGFADGTDFQFHGRIADMPLSALLKSVKSDFSTFDFPLSGSGLKVKGRGKPFSMTADGYVKWPEISIPKFQKKAIYPCHGPLALTIGEDHHLSFDQADFQCGSGNKKGGLLQLKGGLFLKEDLSDLTILGQHIFLPSEIVPSPHPVTGLAEKLSLKIKGPFDRIVTSGDLSLKDVQYGDLSLGTVLSTFALQDDRLTWKNFSSDKIKSQKGFLDLHTADYEIHFDGKHLPMGWILPKDSASFDFVSLSGFLNGNMKTFFASYGDIQFHIKNLSYHSDLYLDDLKGHFIRNQNHLSIDSILARHQSLSYKGDISIGSNKETNDFSFSPLFRLNKNQSLSFAFETVLDQEQKNNLRSLPLIHQKIKDLSIDGFLNLKLKAIGTLEKPNGTILGSLDRLSRKKIIFSPFGIKGQFGYGPVHVKIDHGYGDFLFEGHLNWLQEKKPFALTSHIHQWDIGAILSTYFLTHPKSYAYLSSELQVKGFLNEWEKAEGFLRLDDLSIKLTQKQQGEQQSLLLNNKHPVTLSFAKDLWSFGATRGLELQTKGFSTLIFFPEPSSSEHVHLRAESHLDLNLLPKLWDGLDQASGELTFYADLMGPLRDLRFDLKSAVLPATNGNDSPLSLTFRDSKPSIQNISYDVSFQDGLLYVKSFRGTKGSGSISGQGVWNLFGAKTQESNLFLSFKNVRNVLMIPYLKKFDTLLSGDVRLTGSSVPYLLSGDVSINKANQSQFVDIQKEVVKAIKSDKNMSMEKGDPPFVVFDLSFKGQESIVINNKAMKIFLSSFLKLRGTDKKPSLLGSLSIERGKFLFQQEFQIQRGNILFEPSVVLDPKLDILAQAQVGNYRVNLSFTGKTSDPQIGCFVDPGTKEDGSPISKIDCLILVFQGVLPKDSNHQLSHARGVGMNSLVRFYADLIPIQEILGQSEDVYIYPDVTTTTDGRSVVRGNVQLRVVEGVVGTLSIDQDSEKKASLDVPLTEGIKASVNKTLSSGTSDSKTDSMELDLKFRFSFD